MKLNHHCNIIYSISLVAFYFDKVSIYFYDIFVICYFSNIEVRKLAYVNYSSSHEYSNFSKSKCKFLLGISTKFQMSNHLLSNNQLLGVTPNHWPTNFFLHFCSCDIHEPLVQMTKKINFSWFLNDFQCFRPCERMQMHEQAWICWSKYTTFNF